MMVVVVLIQVLYIFKHQIINEISNRARCFEPILVLKSIT